MALIRKSLEGVVKDRLRILLKFSSRIVPPAQRGHVKVRKLVFRGIAR